MWGFLGNRQEGVGGLSVVSRLAGSQWCAVAGRVGGFWRKPERNRVPRAESGGLISWGFIHFSVGENVVWGLRGGTETTSFFFFSFPIFKIGVFLFLAGGNEIGVVPSL